MTPSLQTRLQDLVHDLGLKLLCFARGRIASSAYVEAHRHFVRRTLMLLVEVQTLQEYVPRLLHYCLDYESLAPSVVELTFQYMAGRCSAAKYRERLRIGFAVMDQLNSLPWAYGIRTRHGADNQRLAPIIQPDIPIDPGCWFSRVFRTSCSDQSYLRIELFAGPETRDRTEGCTPLLARRVRLPAGLPRGERIEVAIQRLDEARMRLELRIPRIDGTAGPWWWIEDSAGFADLATDVARRFREILEKEGAGGGLKPLLTGCMHLLNHHSYLLSEKDGNRLADWVQSTSGALVQRDEEGLRNAARLLLGDLDAVRNESVAVILETLIVTTGAPPEVTTELERLATLLLRHAESSDASRRSVGVELAKRRAVRLVEGWYARWKQESAHEQGAETMQQAEMLVGLLNAIEVPELREMAVESLMAEGPFKWGLLHHFAVAFRTSRWTEDLRQEARALVSHHFRVIEQLAMEVRQEGSYYAHAFHGFTKDSGISAFSAEPRELYQRVIPPAWLWQETSEHETPSPDSEADELLEAIPDEPNPEPVSPLSSLSSPAVSPAWAAASASGVGSRAASPRR